MTSTKFSSGVTHQGEHFLHKRSGNKQVKQMAQSSASKSFILFYFDKWGNVSWVNFHVEKGKQEIVSALFCYFVIIPLAHYCKNKKKTKKFNFTTAVMDTKTIFLGI